MKEELWCRSNSDIIAILPYYIRGLRQARIFLNDKAETESDISIGERSVLFNQVRLLDETIGQLYGLQISLEKVLNFENSRT